jgi:hypothetical protein
MAHCGKCKYSYHIDFGYSNYTVEGVNVYCLFDKNPNLPVDKWYNTEPLLRCECSLYREGKYLAIDVDREEFGKNEDIDEWSKYYIPKWAHHLVYTRGLMLKVLKREGW